MQLFFLAAGILVLAAFFLTCVLADRMGQKRFGTPPAQEAVPRLSPQDADAAAGVLGSAVGPLLALMEHPQLGGPGFLSVQFPAGEPPAAAAQYPNINEALYRRVVRQELDPAALLEEGVPEDLLRLSPVFSAEGGGVVMVTVRTAPLGPAAAAGLASRAARDRTLSLLAEGLSRRYPGLSVRRLGADLLLSPEAREM